MQFGPKFLDDLREQNDNKNKPVRVSQIPFYVIGRLEIGL